MCFFSFLYLKRDTGELLIFATIIFFLYLHYAFDPYKYFSSDKCGKEKDVYRVQTPEKQQRQPLEGGVANAFYCLLLEPVSKLKELFKVVALLMQSHSI